MNSAKTRRPSGSLNSRPPAARGSTVYQMTYAGRSQKYDERMAEPPEQHPRQHGIDGRCQAERPGDQLEQHLGRDADRREQPHDDRGREPVHRQRDCLPAMLPPPRPERKQHHRRPTPRAHDHQRQADVERGVGLERRIERVQHRRLEGENRDDSRRACLRRPTRTIPTPARGTARADQARAPRRRTRSP